MSRLPFVAVAFALALLIGLWSPRSFAEPKDPRVLYKEALAAYDAGEFERALPMFREVVVELESPNAMLYEGRCLRELGKPALAHRAMTRAMRAAAARAGDEPRYAETRDAVATERGALAPRIGLVVIALPPDNEDAVVTLDGEPVTADDLGEPLAVPPGTVTIEASASGRKPVSREVDVAAGETETVTLVLEKNVQPKTEDVGASSVVAPTEPSGVGGLRIAGIVVATVGVAGLVTLGVTGAMADSKFDELFERCGGATCPDGEADAVASGRRLDTIANVSLVAGIIASAGGAAMIIFGGPSEPDEAEASLTFGPGTIGIRGRF